METYLPIIDQYYSDWLAWALINQINAGILAGAVFLITAILYSLRIGFLKRKIRKNEKLHITKQAELLAQIDITQQELKSAQDQLLISTEQLQLVQQTAESESERAKNHESLVNQRNEQISNLIQSLAIKFDLGERPVPLMGDIKAEGLWQQHDRVTNLLAHRLQTEQQAKAQLDQAYQVETLQRRELETLRDTLQTALITQQNELSKLEQALEDQKSILKAQQDKADQALAEALTHSQAELARIPLLEQQLQANANNNQQSTQLLAAKDQLIPDLEKNISEPLINISPEIKPEPEIITPEPKPVSPPVDSSYVAPVTLSEPAEIKTESSATTIESGTGLSSRFKGLFAKGPEKTIEIKIDLPEINPLQAAEASPAIIEKTQPEAIVQPVKEDKSLGFGKLKGMFGRSTKGGKTTEAIISPETALVQVKAETTPDSVPVTPAVVTEPILIEPALAVVKESGAGFADKFKGLLGKKAQEPILQETVTITETAVTEIKIEPENTPELTAEVELDAYIPTPEQNPINFVKDDIAKTKAMISSLFGKKK